MSDTVPSAAANPNAPPEVAPNVRMHKQCWLCHHELSDVYWQETNPKRSYNFQYLRCENCGLVTVSPFIDDPYLGLQANDAYNYVLDIDSYASAISNDALLYIVHKMEQRWAEFGRTGTGRLLEVGCAAGYFMYTAQARNWVVQGVEIAETISAWGRKYLHLPILTGPIEQLQLPDNGYDVVVAIEVLEHVINPKQFLSILWSKLKPGGMLFVTTPNIYSEAYYPPTPTTAVLAPNDHLNLFSTDTLRQLVEQLPFEQIKIEIDGTKGFQLQVFAQKPSRAADLPPDFVREQGVPADTQSLERLKTQVLPMSEFRAPRPTSQSLTSRLRQLLLAAQKILREDGPFILLGRIIRWLGGERRYYRK